MIKNYKRLYEIEKANCEARGNALQNWHDLYSAMEKERNDARADADYYRTEASGLLAKLKEAERDVETAKRRIELIKRAYEAERARRERKESE